MRRRRKRIRFWAGCWAGLRYKCLFFFLIKMDRSVDIDVKARRCAAYKRVLSNDASYGDTALSDFQEGRTLASYRGMYIKLHTDAFDRDISEREDFLVQLEAVEDKIKEILQKIGELCAKDEAEINRARVALSDTVKHRIRGVPGVPSTSVMQLLLADAKRCPDCPVDEPTFVFDAIQSGIDAVSGALDGLAQLHFCVEYGHIDSLYGTYSTYEQFVTRETASRHTAYRALLDQRNSALARNTSTLVYDAATLSRIALVMWDRNCAYDAVERIEYAQYNRRDGGDMTCTWLDRASGVMDTLYGNEMRGFLERYQAALAGRFFTAVVSDEDASSVHLKLLLLDPSGECEAVSVYFAPRPKWVYLPSTSAAFADWLVYEYCLGERRQKSCPNVGALCDVVVKNRKLYSAVEVADFGVIVTAYGLVRFQAAVVPECCANLRPGGQGMRRVSDWAPTPYA